MSITHTLSCDTCGAAYVVRAPTVGNLRASAHADGWHVRHAEPILCPECCVMARAVATASATATARRRAAIKDALARGTKPADLARAYGVSRQRIHQIAKGA